jgi:hypothetical protein
MIVLLSKKRIDDKRSLSHQQCVTIRHGSKRGKTRVVEAVDATSFVGPDRVTELLPRRQRGRPTLYSQEFAEEICERIANRETIEKICETPGTPSHMSVYRWLAERADFRRAYGVAKAVVAEGLFAEAIEIADRLALPFKKPARGEILADPLVSAKLRIDLLLIHAAKLAPKKYGLIEPPPDPAPALPDPEDAKVVSDASAKLDPDLAEWLTNVKGAP